MIMQIFLIQPGNFPEIPNSILEKLKKYNNQWQVSILAMGQFLRGMNIEADVFIPVLPDSEAWRKFAGNQPIHFSVLVIPAVPARLEKEAAKWALEFKSDYVVYDTPGIERLTLIIDRLSCIKNTAQTFPVNFQELQFKAIVDNSPAGIALINKSGRFVYVNNRSLEISGFTREELLNKNFTDVITPGERERIQELFMKRQLGKDVTSLYETEILTNTGQPKPVEIRATVISATGNELFTLIQVIDLSHKKRLEEQLLRERDLLYTILTHIPDFIYFKDPQCRFTRINYAMAEYFGLPNPNEAIGKTLLDFLPAKQAKALMDEEKKLLSSGTPIINKIEHVQRRGKEFYFVVTKVPYYDRQNNVAGLVGISRDLTPMIKMEEALKASEKQYRSLIEQSNDAIYLLYNGKFEVVNRKFCEMLGYSPEEIKSGEFDFLKLVAPKSRRFIQERYEKSQRGEVLPPVYEFTALTKDGREIELEASVSYLKYKNGTAAQGILRDITERKRVQMEINRLASVIEQAGEVVLITDTEGKILYVNKAFQRITGYTPEEAIGQTPSILASGHHDEKFYKNLWRTIKTGKIWQAEMINRKKDGSEFHVKSLILLIRNPEGEIVNFAQLMRDITQEIHLEEQVRQSQKMEAIGKLAGGVAHDFNNLLTVINGYSEILQASLPENSKARRAAEQIRLAGERAASLTNQLLAFSRKQVVQPTVLNLNEVIRSTEKMLKRLIGEDIELISRLSENIKSIKIDPTQIDQVIMNMVVNARDAMPRGGKLTLETKNVELSEEYCAIHAEAQPGQYVMLAISDTGIGMSKQTMSQIFEPFFTTKGQGKGTGLGLSTVYGIIKQNNGFINVYSEPGHGSTFKIYFPVFEKEIVEKEEKDTNRENLTGNEHILLMEDENTVRELAFSILKQAGYRITVCRNGMEAIERLKEAQTDWQLILTDVVMPKMSGVEAVEIIRNKFPEIPVIYMSGYTDDAILRHGLIGENIPFIQKPFTPKALLQKIREVLDR
ncbi:MAG: hypothetical protein Kow0037_21880 [Calditrichia bacterium]